MSGSAARLDFRAVESQPAPTPAVRFPSFRPQATGKVTPRPDGRARGKRPKAKDEAAGVEESDEESAEDTGM